MSAALLAYLAARKRHKKEKRRRDIDAVIDALKDDEEKEDDRAAATALAEKKKAAKEKKEKEEKEERAREGVLCRGWRLVWNIIGSTSLQTIQYVVMLFCFQSLASTIRVSDEFYLDKFVGSMIVDNSFDAAHRTMRDVRRPADLYGWMSNTLVPALFHNAAEGQAWPDGDGPFSHVNATPYSIEDMLDEANIFALPDGIIFKQVRMHAHPSKPCYANHSCYVQLAPGDDGDTRPYGFGPNGTGHFTWWSAAELGANPAGEVSASHISSHLYSSAGFLAAFRPFFSDAWLPDEEGPLSSIRDFRPHEATPTNGRVARYQCARYTTNGNHTVQRCDPGALGSTEVTRRMMVEMLDFLKKAHFVDRQTALLTITATLRNNNVGLKFSTRWMFEFTPLSGVLPSYFTETLIFNPADLEARAQWLLICLIITCWFAGLELVEIVGALRESGSVGLIEYASSMWNVLDWLNFLLFSYVYLLLTQEAALHERDAANEACTSHLCASFGYFDPWEIFNVARMVKLFLSFCVCIQFLKVIKFTNTIVPKMGLMTRVLAKGASDLVFFGIIFCISMFAFSMLFYLQMGAAVDNYYSVVFSMLSLTRSLFGDFPFEEIMENSNS